MASSSSSKRYVINRQGEEEPVDFTKIVKKIEKLSEGLEGVHPDIIIKDVITNFNNGCTTKELDELSIRFAHNMPGYMRGYDKLACRLLLDVVYRDTPDSFSASTAKLAEWGTLDPIYSGFVKEHAEQLNAMVDLGLDHNRNYYGLKTFISTYCLKANGVPAERPQYSLLRVATAVWYPRKHADSCRCAKCEPHEHDAEDPDEFCSQCKDRLMARKKNPVAFEPKYEYVKATETDLNRIKKMYLSLARLDYMHATPTMFSAGTKCGQFNSCFLASVDDSAVDIYHTLTNFALVSQSAGGFGLHTQNIRAKGARLVIADGTSNGLVPMVRNYNETARYMDQGGGKRKGGLAIYVVPWHLDFLDTIQMKKSEGPVMTRATDSHFALWVPDIFMKRLVASKSGSVEVMWSLFCPKDAPKLLTTWGDAFTKQYEEYEAQGKAKKRVNIWKLWEEITDLKHKTGEPYTLFSDTACRRTNQSNLGIITGSNLCSEIIEFTDKNEIAVCTLASLCLPSCVVTLDDGTRFVDYDKLALLAEELVYNLNQIIDRSKYPVPETRRSSMRHRAIGIGMQGLADVFHLLKLEFTSVEAQEINHRIAEAIYFGALTGSNKLAKEHGPYETYNLKTQFEPHGTKVSRGILAQDTCRRPPILDDPDAFEDKEEYFNSYNADGTPKTFMPGWNELRADIKLYGVRNSLLIALMPTSTTSRVTGNNECFEPYTGNAYVPVNKDGTDEIVNVHLFEELQASGVVNDAVYKRIVRNNGSVKDIPGIPEEIKRRYATVYEISQRKLIYMAHQRGIFCDQSQSMNMYFKNAKGITPAMILAWALGLTTGAYYTYIEPPPKGLEIRQEHGEKLTASREMGDLLKKSDEGVKDSICDEGCLSCDAPAAPRNQ